MIDAQGIDFEAFSRPGRWEWTGFKNPAYADRLGYWAWRGGAMGYTWPPK